jgi:hypothetical protein
MTFISFGLWELNILVPLYRGRIFRVIDHAVASPHCQAIGWRRYLIIDIQRLRSQSTDDQLVLSSVAYIAQESFVPPQQRPVCPMPHGVRANQKRPSFKLKKI